MSKNAKLLVVRNGIIMTEGNDSDYVWVEPRKVIKFTHPLDYRDMLSVVNLLNPPLPGVSRADYTISLIVPEDWPEDGPKPYNCKIPAWEQLYLPEGGGVIEWTKTPGGTS